MKVTFTPKNWKTFQHYRDRKPAWIKLHRELLDDYDYARLPVASRALAPMLWLLASEYEDGVIEGEIDLLAFRMRMSVDDLVEGLNPLLISGFFIRDSGPLADCKQVAIPEREREEERETERQVRGREKKTGKILLPDSWIPSASHYELAKERGLTRNEVEDAAHEMRSWSLGNGERRSNWDWVFNNWLRRNAQRRNGASNGATKTSKSLVGAADRIIEQLENINRPPEIRSPESATVIQLLPKG